MPATLEIRPHAAHMLCQLLCRYAAHTMPAYRREGGTSMPATFVIQHGQPRCERTCLHHRCRHKAAVQILLEHSHIRHLGQPKCMCSAGLHNSISLAEGHTACILHISPLIPSHTSRLCLHGGCMALNVVMSARAAATLSGNRGFAHPAISCKLDPAEHERQLPMS